MSHIVFVATLSVSALLASPESPDPRENVDTAISTAIRLLEERDYERLVQWFIHPDDSQNIASRRDLNRALRPLGPGDKASHMLTILRSIKDSRAQYSDDGTIASFEIPWHGLARGASIRTIQFRKSGKFWYLTL